MPSHAAGPGQRRPREPHHVGDSRFVGQACLAALDRTVIFEISILAPFEKTNTCRAGQLDGRSGEREPQASLV